jgi:GxxExxY protein
MEETHPHAELTRPIIGAAMEVHRVLGCGFLESVYESALCVEFDLQKIPYQRQKCFDILYKGRPAKSFMCDLVVYDTIIVELKAIQAITAIEEAQLLNYLKVTNLHVGLVLNFGAKSLEVKRRVL